MNKKRQSKGIATDKQVVHRIQQNLEQPDEQQYLVIDQEYEEFNGQQSIQNGMENQIQEIKNKVIQIRSQYNENGTLYTDKDFILTNQTLFQNNIDQDWQAVRINDINRACQFDNLQHVSNYQLRNGRYSSNNFLNAISFFKKQNLYWDFFIDFDNLHIGYCICQFNKDGKNQYVIIDTLLPYNIKQKQFLFSYLDFQNIFWLSLLEKAYAKLYEGYYKINKLKLKEILVDISGSYLEKKIISEQTEQNQQNFYLELLSSLNNSDLIVAACNKTKDKAITIGQQGIAQNMLHGIISVEEISSSDQKFIQVENYWGLESNWKGVYSRNSDEIDRIKNQKDSLQQRYLSIPHHIYFMWLIDFTQEFSHIILLRRFKQEKWKTYSHNNKWFASQLGGLPSDLGLLYPQDQSVQDVNQIKDSDIKWFDNPQYWIQIQEKARLYICLSQKSSEQDIYFNSYIQLFSNKCNQTRIWEYQKTNEILSQIIPKQGDKVCKNVWGYYQIESQSQNLYETFNLILSLEQPNQNNSVSYNIKIYSDKPIIFEPYKNLLQYKIFDQWLQDSQQGYQYVDLKSNQINPFWCQNPQYLINTFNITSVKIILKKSQKSNKKTKNAKIGMFLVYLNGEKQLKYFSTHTNDKQNTKKFNKTQKRKQEKTFGTPYLQELKQKLIIQQNDWYIHSTFANAETSSIFIKLQPHEGPFLIIPCLEEPDCYGDFSIQFYSSDYLYIKKLNKQKNQTIVSKWNQFNSGGSHLYIDQYQEQIGKRTWNTNSIFELTFLEELFQSSPSKQVIIWLVLAGKTTRIQKLQKQDSNSQDKQQIQTIDKLSKIDKMLGLYILNSKENITTDNIIYHSGFYPKQNIEFVFEFNKKDFPNTNTVFIMPATYSNEIKANFIISLFSESFYNFKKV